MGGAIRCGRFGGLATALLACTLVACTDEAANPPAPVLDGGVDADSAVEAGPDAGPLQRACMPGETELPDGACQPAGIPAEECGEGFAPTGDGSCTAVLPATACGPGQMAIPGESTCRELAVCSGTRWGNAPVDGDTQYVDVAYSGGSSDGSEAHPWTVIQDAVNAAAPGAVVAIAAGTYSGDVRIADKPIRLWGSCPAEVEIAGADYPLDSVDIGGAHGTEVHDLAITGPDFGVSVANAVDVVLDQVWIHDTELAGVHVQYNAGPARATLRRSLVEHAHRSGVEAWRGGEVLVEESTIRSILADLGDWGFGINAQGFDDDDQPSRVAVVRSVIEDNREFGISALYSDLTVEDSVVRGTLPNELYQVDGMGIMVARSIESPSLRTFEIRRSVVDGNHTCGVCVFDANTTVVATAIRGTLPQPADGRRGSGLIVATDLSTGPDRATASIRSSTVEDNHMLGIGLAGVDAQVESTLVRDTEPEQSTGLHGRGLIAEIHPYTQDRTSLQCMGSAVERSHEVGLLVLGSDATLDGLAVRDTRPSAADQRFGRGLILQFSAETLDLATGTLDHGSITDSHEVGICVVGAEFELRDTVVEGTRQQAAGEIFGDGVIALTHPIPGQPLVSTIDIERCRIQQSARAGVASFGAGVALGSSIIDCNTLDLAAETYDGRPAELHDQGSNVCGCASEPRPCQVLSSGLQPPEPL